LSKTGSEELSSTHFLLLTKQLPSAKKNTTHLPKQKRSCREKEINKSFRESCKQILEKQKRSKQETTTTTNKSKIAAQNRKGAQ
jgi:hypothetical protein